MCTLSLCLVHAMPPQSTKIEHLPSDASAILRERYLAGTLSVVTQWRIKLSNAGDCYLWNITSDILLDGSCMDMTAYQQGLFFTTQCASINQQDSPDLNTSALAVLLSAQKRKKQQEVSVNQDNQQEYFSFSLGGSIINMVKCCQTTETLG